jgi:cytochrome b561
LSLLSLSSHKKEGLLLLLLLLLRLSERARENGASFGCFNVAKAHECESFSSRGIGKIFTKK